MNVATGTWFSYALGFLISLLMTLVAYFAVALGLAAAPAIIVTLAIGQLAVQLVLFLHVGLEPKPRWTLITFLLTAVVLLILLFGSLWIMHNLHYRL